MYHDDIVELVEITARSTGRSPHTIGRLAAGSGDFYARLKRGCDLTTRRAATVVQYLSDHWPEGLEWPSDIPRPPRSADSKEAA